MLAQPLRLLSSSRYRQLRTSARRPLQALEARLARHPPEQPILRSDVERWLDEVRLELEPQSPSNGVAATGPLVRSILVGAAVASVTPVFMLLPLLVVFVPVSAIGGVQGSTWTLKLLAPWLVNKPVALANFGAASCFTLCRDVLSAGRLPTTVSGQLWSGALVGLAVGAAAPFAAAALALPLAQLLPYVGIPCDTMTMTMAAVAGELDTAAGTREWPWRAGCLVVTLPMGVGAGAMTSVMLVPAMMRGPGALALRVLPLVVAWVVAAWVWGEPTDPEFLKFSEEAQRKFEGVEEPQPKPKRRWWHLLS